MGAYRDDLQAARERIRSLEREVQALRAERERSLTRRVGSGFSHVHDAGGLQIQQGPRVAVWIGLVLAVVLALRGSSLVPVVVAVVIVIALFNKLRMRWVVARPHEVVAVDSGAADSHAPSHTMPWFGPGRALRAVWGRRLLPVPVGAELVEGTVRQVVTRGGALRDIELVAVVVVRLDEDGLEQAVGRASIGATDTRGAAWTALEATVRSCAATLQAESIDAEMNTFEQRLRQEADDALDAVGLVLVAVGVRRARPSAAEVARLSERILA